MQQPLRKACEGASQIALRHLSPGRQVIDDLRQDGGKMLFDFGLRQTRHLRDTRNPVGTEHVAQLIG